MTRRAVSSFDGFRHLAAALAQDTTSDLWRERPVNTAHAIALQLTGQRSQPATFNSVFINVLGAGHSGRMRDDPHVRARRGLDAPNAPERERPADVVVTRQLSKPDDIGPSYENHHVNAGIYSPLVIVEACKAAMDVLERHQHRPVTMLAVAAMAINMHEDMAGTSHDSVMGLVNMFSERLRALEVLAKAEYAVPTPDDSEAT